MNIVVIGCGRMGSGLAQTMQRRGDRVTIVDREPCAFDLLGPTFQGQTLLGNALDRALLEAAGIAQADGLASVTNSDEINIVVARLARTRFHVPRVVARVVEPRKAEIYQRLGLQTISTTTWGIDRMANLLSRAARHVQAALGNEVELVDVEIPGHLAGRTVFNLTIASEIHVVAITRAGTTFLPSHSTALQAGDTVHLAMVAASADRLTALLG
jgi:trk system potassium uptake protein TrkA